MIAMSTDLPGKKVKSKIDKHEGTIRAVLYDTEAVYSWFLLVQIEDGSLSLYNYTQVQIVE